MTGTLSELDSSYIKQGDLARLAYKSNKLGQAEPFFGLWSYFISSDLCMHDCLFVYTTLLYYVYFMYLCVILPVQVALGSLCREF